MKKMALFMALVLLLGTIDARHLVQGVKSLFPQEVSCSDNEIHKCCQVSSSDIANKCLTVDGDEGHVGCCQDGYCDCNCCKHLLLFSGTLHDLDFCMVDFSERFFYDHHHDFNYVHSIFIPPSLS